MSVGKGFMGGFGGCLGVGCAAVVVLVAIPVGCLMIGGVAVHNAQQTGHELAEKSKTTSPSTPSTSHATTPDPKPAPVEKDTHPTDLVTSDASAVFAAYERNEVQADNDMKDKWFAVKGRVEKIGKDIINTPYVALSVEKQVSIFSVQCMFKKSEESVLADLQPGQVIVVGGKCAGKMGNVLMRECWLYDEGPAQREKANEQAEERRKAEARAAEARQAAAKRKAEHEAAIDKAKWHTWTSADGLHKIEAKFVTAIGDTAQLEKKDGTVIKIKRDKLSDEDWAWITNKGWNNP